MNEKILENLNSEQKSAVWHKDGPLLIIAGAGTGKTRVIAARIAHIIAQKWAKPSEILALTFTEKAAGEMEGKVDLLVPYGFVDTWISTFHAFGDRVLRDFAIDLGLPANFRVLSQTEQAVFMRQNLYGFDLRHFRPLANPSSHIEELLKHFSRLKDELVSPEDYLDFARKKRAAFESKGKTDKESEAKRLDIERQEEAAKAYRRYQELMLQAGNLDYGDQIFLTHKLLSQNPPTLQNLQEKFKYILIDEFQDTNFAQYQIAKLLAKRHRDITVCGDDDQSIYRFRGASISNILSFKEDYPDCRQIVLNKNYRSTQQILDSAYRLIRHNNPDRLEVKNNISKRLIAQKQGELPRLINCNTLSCEADRVAQKIAKLKGEIDGRWSDFAILARANNHLEPFIQALNHKNIPNVFVGLSSLFRQSEVKMLIAFLRCLFHSDDNLAFHQLATSELYGVGEDLLAAHYGAVKRQNTSFEEIFRFRSEREAAVGEILDDLKDFRQKASTLAVGELLYEFVTKRKLLKRLSKEGSAEAEMKIGNIARLFDRVHQFQHASSDTSALTFLENLELIAEVGDEVASSDVDSGVDAVNVMTVHSAKGLEWPVVFIVNMVSDRFPSRDRREKIAIPDELIKEKLPEGDYHLQEERRLFYVGCTRAKDRLFLTGANDYGGKRAKKLSPFVLELLDEANLATKKERLSSLEKIKRHAPSGPNAKPPSKPRQKNDAILKISRQQLDDYHTCPKKYYFSAIIKIPLPLNWHFMYGTAIHEAIGRYFQRKINEKKPSLASLTADFEQSFVSEGFITREHEEERKSRGIETLRRFFNEDQKINLIPERVEERFEFKEGPIKISGRYDLVLGDKEGNEIRDFKTSEVKDQKDADRRIRESTQMMVYALAWRENHGGIPKTALVFIESGLKGERTFSEEELSRAKATIHRAAEGIIKSDFTAKPNARQCSLCPYKDVCSNSAA